LLFKKELKMRILDQAEIRKAIMAWPGLYESRDGVQFFGMPVSQIPAQLRAEGWRNVAQFNDRRTLEKMGLMIEEARYVGGVRPKSFCNVVIASFEVKRSA
jgi:hypothetical protein